jgi:nucleolar protein 53
MGGKRRGAPRQRKRADRAAESLADATVEAQLEEIVESKADDELFVLDTAPQQNVLSKKEKQRLEEERRTGKKSKRGLSEKDQKHVAKLIKSLRGDAERIAKHAEEGRKSMGTQKSHRDGTILNKELGITRREVSYDLWSSVTDAKADKKQKKESKRTSKRNMVAVDVAQGGQSYHPDQEEHQNMIGEALALEVSRNEAIQYEREPLSNGMSEETLAVLIQSDDEEEESDEEEQTEEKDALSFKPLKMKGKLTKAQRNKQKRHRRLQLELQRRRKEKKLLNSVNEVKKVKKQLDREEREQSAKKEELSRVKEEEFSKPLGGNLHEALLKANPTKALSLPVALTSELEEGGSLRSMRPKGCMIEERLSSFVVRNMANSKKTAVRVVTEGKRRKEALGSEFMLRG